MRFEQITERNSNSELKTFMGKKDFWLVNFHN